MLHEENRHTFIAQALDHSQNLINQNGREPHAWLVQQQQFRARHHCAANRQHLLLPAGQRARHALTKFLQHREHVKNMLLVFFDVFIFAQIRAKPQIIFHRQRRENLTPLRRLRNAARHAHERRRTGNVFAFKRDLAIGYRLHTGNRAQQRGFTRAVRADKRHDLTLGNREIDAAQRLNASVK